MYPLRGLMLDPARLTERRAVYRDFVAIASQWNYNALFWHFTDDEGCALQFPSRPELASPHAYAPAEMRALIAYAAHHGIDIIPEIECFGHAGFITSVERYRHLDDSMPGKVGRALCVFEPEAQALLRDLLRDTAQLFPSPYIHVGMDETAFGTHPTSARLLKTKPKYELYAEHVCWLHKEVTRLGKTMIMWADHLYPVPKDELTKAKYLDTDSINDKIAALLPRDIIMCVWQYNPKPRQDYVTHLRRLGFRVLICPATSAWGLVAHPRTWNLDNLADSALLARRNRADGMVNTVWCSQRYFPGVTLFGIAYAAVCRDSRGEQIRPPYARFVRQTFGIDTSNQVAAALKTLHAVTPHKNILERAMPVARENLEGVDAQTWQTLEKMATGAQSAWRQLLGARALVRFNHVYYDDILHAAGLLSHVGDIASILQALLAIREAMEAQNTAGDKRTARTSLQTYRAILGSLVQQQRVLVHAAQERWNATRFSDDPKRHAGCSVAYGDALLPRLFGALKFFTAAHREASAALRGATTITLVP